jgi:hypothetical protein
MKAKFAVVAFAIGLGITAVVVSAPGQGVPPVPPNAPPGEAWDYKTFPSFPNLAGYTGFAKSSAEEQQLAHQANELAHKLRDAKGDNDKDKLKTKLTETLEKQFDVRQKRHTTEIDNLEAQVKKLKELVQKRQEARRDIITKRLDQLQREAEGLGW